MYVCEVEIVGGQYYSVKRKSKNLADGALKCQIVFGKRFLLCYQENLISAFLKLRIDMSSHISKKNATYFVILMGLVSLFADMTYEGARSITGQYLALLGANGLIIGIVSGAGELIGYGFRLVSGYLSDQTRRYWTFTIVGFAINLLAVPLLALAGNWPLAAALIIAERFGKAVRTPARDAMLSFATKQIGRGWGFGLHEALDQIGAIMGPLIISTILYFQGSYQMSFAVMLVPVFFALAILIFARYTFPKPEDLEVPEAHIHPQGLSKPYWIYVAGICLVAAGFVDFPLIAYHFQKTESVPVAWMPIFYAIAMGVDGLAALVLGKSFDKYGLRVLIYSTALTAIFPLLVFYGAFELALLGMVLWGIGLGAQESIVRAYIADLVSADKRGTAYGMLHLWFGVFWFLGSALMGYLYDTNLVYLVAFSIFVQLTAIPFFYSLDKQK